MRAEPYNAAFRVAGGRARARARHRGAVVGARALLAAAAFAAAGVVASSAHAQVFLPSVESDLSDIISPLTPEPQQADNVLQRPVRPDNGMNIGDWMFYPKMSAGAIYNDNLLGTELYKQAAVGADLSPDLYIQRDNGTSNTTLDVSVDGQVYPSRPSDSVYNGQAILQQTWRVQHDLTIDAGLEYDHFTYLINGGQIVAPNGALAYLTSQETYQQVQGRAAVRKDFDRLFVGLAVNGVETINGPIDTVYGPFSENYRDSFVTTLTARAGYWAAPALYIYTEVSGNQRDIVDQQLSSDGYRLLAGVGTDRLSLFRGEIYAGYQRQVYSAIIPGGAESPVFGGKVYWYPTRTLTLSGSLDENFTDSNAPTPGNPLGYPARDTAAQFNIDYKLPLAWTATLHNRFDNLVYLDTTRVDEDWQTGLKLGYQINRGLGVSFDYTYIRSDTNVPFSSFADNVVTLGGDYKF